MKQDILDAFKNRWLDPEEPKGRVVISHDYCNDGIMSVYVATNAILSRTDDVVVGVELLHYGPGHSTLPAGSFPKLTELCKDKLVLISDFSFSKEVTLELMDVADSLVIVDHHKTAKEAGLDELDNAIIDMDTCGALATYKYLVDSEEHPDILTYVNDYDLGKFEHGNVTASVEAYLKDYRVSVYDTLSKTGNKISEMMKPALFGITFMDDLARSEWPIITKHKDISNSREAKKLTTDFMIKGVPFKGGNSTGSATQVLTKVYKEHKCRAVSFWFTDTAFQLSFRSPSEDLPVDGVAKALGGGGHVCASGVMLELTPENMPVINKFLLEHIIE